VARPKNRLGLPALTTPEAVVLFVALTALFSLLTALLFGDPASGLSIALALLIASLTPNYRRKRDSG
jgi:hypothetical protein